MFPKKKNDEYKIPSIPQINTILRYAEKLYTHKRTY